MELLYSPLMVYILILVTTPQCTVEYVLRKMEIGKLAVTCYILETLRKMAIYHHTSRQVV